MGEKTITATKLRRDLGSVLDAVARGETVHITRQGRPLCTLVPPGVHAELSKAVEHRDYWHAEAMSATRRIAELHSEK